MEQAAWRGFFRIGGAAFTVASILYVALLVILRTTGGLPNSGEELLSKLASQTLLLQFSMILFIIIDLCLLVAFAALHIALSGVNRVWPLVGNVFASVALILDIISGLIVYSLPGFISSYAAATSTARPAYTVTAELLYGYIWKVESPFVVALLSLTALLFSLVMLASTFPKFTAYMGIGVGTIGFVGGLLGFIHPLLLFPLWLFPTGIQLYRQGSRHLSQTV